MDSAQQQRAELAPLPRSHRPRAWLSEENVLGTISEMETHPPFAHGEAGWPLIGRYTPVVRRRDVHHYAVL